MPIISGGSGGGSGVTTLRKVTNTTVSGTVAETDLLGGALTLVALSTTNVITLDLWGDYVQTVADGTALPILKLKLGATVLFQWQPWSSMLNSKSVATRFGWNYRAVIGNANATNVQHASLIGMWSGLTSSATTAIASTLNVGEGTRSAVGGGAGSQGLEHLVAYNTAAVDTSTAQAITFTTTNGTASTPYDITLGGCLVSIL